MSRPNAWLLSAYHTDSHAYWADRLVRHLQGLEWHPLTLPGRHFRWRIRGNPLSWLDRLPQAPPAVLLATSMVDLATLKGLHPRLARVPTLYYFHENQFAYPRSAQQHPSIDPQMVQLYGALAADLVAFNSVYNRDSFLAGVEQLAQRLPDRVPRDLAARFAHKSRVLPVPIDPPGQSTQPRDQQLILWNHRWEYDKAPQVFSDAIERLLQRDCPCRLALLGGRGEPPHPALQHLRDVAAQRIVADGRLPEAQYQALVRQAGIVVSTAIHEFQGIALLEAASGGARPLVPDGLCYPEQYPQAYRYRAGDAVALADRLQHWLHGNLPPRVDVSAWTDARLVAAWRSAISELLDSG
jgi:glycosyltransferase involved in cell wall biosynthesis